MAEIEIIFQGLSQNDDHETKVNELLKNPDLNNYLFSLAFARKSGVDEIKNNLRNVAHRSTIYIGIRNGVTSVQSVFSLLEAGVSPYAVDTASSRKIFHPKVYAAYSDTKAFVILGSANLTHGGLNQNIEASSFITLDRTHQIDNAYMEKLISTITQLPTRYPDHVFQITSAKQAVKLLREGRLEDERLIRLPATSKPQGNKVRDNLKPMPTFERKSPAPNKAARMQRIKIADNTAILMWESKPLTERSLNIPQGENTNITGDTNLGQGLMEDIDFQHYFRKTVFSDLKWRTDPSSKSPHLERAKINAEIVIKNISYGVYSLEVTHDPRTNTKSYRQKNVMTKIKWGQARDLIAKRDLLDRTLRLYKKSSSDFMIVID